LWKNDEKPNTTFVKDRLQGRYHELGLPRRLHTARLAWATTVSTNSQRCSSCTRMVYLTYSFDVQAAIDNDVVVVVE
jgi:hypothetical protein